ESFAMDGDTLCGFKGDRFLTYRFLDLSESLARFALAGSYTTNSTLLERAFGLFPAGTACGDGLAYVTEGRSGGIAQSRRLTVFDIRDPRRPRPVAHFAVPGEERLVICPLPGRRALVGG